MDTRLQEFIECEELEGCFETEDEDWQDLQYEDAEFNRAWREANEGGEDAALDCYYDRVFSDR